VVILSFIASGAKQSGAASDAKLDCFVASLLAMTEAGDEHGEKPGNLSGGLQ
jgi:hypothetical protein